MMHRYDRNNDNFDSFGWEEEDEFDLLSQRFEKNSGRKAHNGNVDVDARRRVEDHQEKRRLKKRMRLSIDSWGNVE